MPRSRALACASVNSCTATPTFIQTRPFGVNNSSAAPKPILIGCTCSSAESCLDFSWGQDGHRSVQPTPSSPRCAQEGTGPEGVEALLQLSAALLPELFYFQLMLPGKVPELERNVFCMTRPHRVENEYILGLQLLSRRFCERPRPQRCPQLTPTGTCCKPITELGSGAHCAAFSS